MSKHGIERAPDERINWVSSTAFLLVHALVLLTFWTGITRTAAILFLVLFWGRMFFITGGYHRYFAHRSYKTSRAMQFILAFGGGTAAQKGALWWAGHHRNHHRYSDTERDLHSPQKGFWWSHLGWILCDKNNDFDVDGIKDFAKYPELRFLTKHDWIPPWTVGIASYLIGGWSGLVFGFFGSTVLLWHATFLVNSLAHVMGRRRYATTDTSRNSAIIAFLTMGEGWHNNHHYYQASVRQGFYWWEWDPTYYVIRTLGFLRLVWDIKEPPARVKTAARVREGAFDHGMFRAHWAKASVALNNARSLLREQIGDGGNVPGEIAPESAATALEATAVGAAPGTTSVPADTAADPDATGRREQLEDLIATNKAALQESIASALAHAEELGRLSYRRDRQAALATD